MEILHNLWNVVSTEDENLTKYVVLSLAFVEPYVTMKLFTSILDIKYTKKQRNIYIFLMGILIILSNLLIPKQFSLFINLIIIPIIIKLIFKTSMVKTIIAEIIPMIIIILLETVYVKICLMVFGISITQCANILVYRMPYMLFTYLTVFLFSKLVKFIKINLNAFEKINKTHKKLLVTNLVLNAICFSFQFYLLIFYSAVLPTFTIFLNLVFLITYSIVSIYSINKTVNLEITKTYLEQSNINNNSTSNIIHEATVSKISEENLMYLMSRGITKEKAEELLYNNMRAFKHDFSNIITALGGFIYAKDINGLEKYYNKILEECHINNNLSTLNPEIINNAAVYNILATKYYKADELDINIDLQVFINLNDLKMDIYDFSRSLGILLDNAIEAASKCNKKVVKIEIRDIKPRKCQILTIENTYLDTNIDLNKIFEKGYTSKTEDKENHGIGLWQVAKIIKKHKNVLLDTSKTNELFKQELAIYYK